MSSGNLMRVQGPRVTWLTLTRQAGHAAGWASSFHVCEMGSQYLLRLFVGLKRCSVSTQKVQTLVMALAVVVVDTAHSRPGDRLLPCL